MVLVSDPTLSRQLNRLKLDEEVPPTSAQWKKLLKYLDAHYRHVDDDRDMMARSLEVSTEEMARIRGEISAERDELKTTLELFHKALEDFAAACRATRNSGGEDTTAITGARKRFNMSILGLLASARESSEEYRELLNGLRESFVDVFEEVMSMVSPDGAISDEIVGLQQALIEPFGEWKQEGIYLAALCEQLNDLGGDLWMRKSLADGSLFFCIGDATGHGATAGFFSAMVATALRSYLEEQSEVDLEKLFHHLNGLVASVGAQRMFMTWTGVLIHRDRRSATILNAGHVFPILVRGKTSRPLVIQGNPLGTQGDTSVKIGRLEVQGGDRLVLYTDGITESTNELHEEYGERRLRKLLDRKSDLGPRELAFEIREEAQRFRGNAKSKDDATVMVVEINEGRV